MKKQNTFPPQTPSRYKHRGDSLLLALFFSMMVIMIGVGLSRFLVQDLFVLRDTIFSEKSYYAAESGVEKALLALKESPINAIEVADDPLGTATVSILAKNNVSATVFTLNDNNTRRIKLVRDTDLGFGEVLEAVTDMSISKEAGEVSYRLICQKELLINGTPAKRTISINGRLKNGLLRNQEGNIDDIDSTGKDTSSAGKRVSDLWGIQDLIPTSCYLNLQNLGANPIDITLTQPKGMSPETTVVTSVGEAGHKKKVISFEVKQSNLGGLFDFGLLHTE